MEKWKTLTYNNIRYNKYEVSTMGRLRLSKDKRLCKLYKHRSGYMTYYKPLEKGETKRLFLKMHRAVAFTFIPNPDNLLEVNHIDGVKDNNHINNLEWVNHKDNILHAWKSGLVNKSNPGCSSLRKLSDKEAEEVKRNRFNLNGVTLAKKYKVSKDTIYNIQKGKLYREIG